MEARALIIEDKLKASPVNVVKPSDFKVRDGGPIDPRIVINAKNLSLYCLDFEKRQALFVETPPDCDLSRAPFLYQAQYDSACRVIQVPYDTLHSLAAEVAIDPSKLILIYSVGRCGSTLVSQAYNAIEGVESISEPDVFTQMRGAWGASGLGDADKAQLLKSCTLLQCAPGQMKGATAWALKFRSMVMDLGDLFYSVFPMAKIVFLYRSAEPWARSFARLMRVSDPTTEAPLADVRSRFGRSSSPLESRTSASALEILASLWTSVMKRLLKMQERGIPMFIARYEELNADPWDVLTHMFAYCGLSENAVSNLNAVLEQDSQAGSSLSRASLGEAPVQLSPEHMTELGRLISEYCPGLTADSILCGTYFPESVKNSLQVSPAAR